MNCKDTEVKNTHIHTLDKIFNDFLSNPKTILVIPDTSIKNNVATSISYIHSGRNILAKTIHHVINVTSTEVELFSIRCRINQAVQVSNAKNIIVITDAIHLQDVSLIHLPTHINCIPLLYLRILEHSLTRALTTQLLFGIALAVSNGFLTQPLIKRPNDSILTLFSLVNYHGILARKKNAT